MSFRSNCYRFCQSHQGRCPFLLQAAELCTFISISSHCTALLRHGRFVDECGKAASLTSCPCKRLLLVDVLQQVGMAMLHRSPRKAWAAWADGFHQVQGDGHERWRFHQVSHSCEGPRILAEGAHFGEINRASQQLHGLLPRKRATHLENTLSMPYLSLSKGDVEEYLKVQGLPPGTAGH